MLVFRGKQRVEKKEGFFVELCPVCRKFTPYQLFRISLAKNLYGKALGEGDPRGYEGMCLECGTRIDVDPSDYRTFYETPGNSISNLIRDTFPTIRKARAPRLRLERALREGTLKLDERRALLIEPFRLFSEPVRRLYQTPGRWLNIAGLLVVTTCAVAALVLVTYHRTYLTPSEREILSPTGPVVAAAAVLLFLTWICALYVLLSARRPFQQKILPGLAKALKPLNPTREELTACLEEMRRAKAIIGRKVTVSALTKHLG